MAMDSDMKMLSIFFICLVVMMVGMMLCGVLGDCVNHDVILIEKQIELEKLKQKNPVKEVKENDTQRQDKNRPTSNPTGL